nr:right-handed parallel beta-helix repeat-containing protein [Candidatus Woesearchaeota archaeon]
MRKYLILLAVLFLVPILVEATATCTFTNVGNVMNLDGDCTTDETLLIPDGFTLDGNNHVITAIDPVGNHFKGAVVSNSGSTANVENLVVDTDNLANVCDGGSDRLRGIMFEAASGSIMHNEVRNINQGASGCQEGNAIEVRNAPFDGTHPDTKNVEIAHNKIVDWQKTGIVANGDVDVNIHHNQVDESATQANLAANSIQLGFGATGIVTQNLVEGNQWCGPSDYVATAILIYLADNSVVSKNVITGNADVGIYGEGDALEIDNNKVFDDISIADCNAFGYDFGVFNYGTGNLVTNNKVRDYATSYDGVSGGKNKVIPGPQPGNDFWD